ncbi:protein kinase domain-containing protein [Streptomyces synnematoformans]|uniref:Protein kinase domain-containing protein n=1 Tax=Streptomyces synnematoformans TaxID=415721 RepID=A0ABP5JGP2_9ACTN
MKPLADGDPTRVGEFVLRGRLGAGGMGAVYYGRSPGGRAVAVKVVHRHLAAQDQFRRRFRQEVAAIRAVSGAFTAPVVGAGPEDDLPWIATVYVSGLTLTDAVAETGPLPESSLWPLAAGLVEALRAIHEANLLHRDLKPANVLLAPDGPRVIDFGISRALDGTALTDTGVLIGTPGYMAPEQVEREETGPAADVFALGAVLAYAATGEEPFGLGPPLAVLHRVVSGTPQLDTLDGGPLRALVADCLDKAPARRPTPAQLLDRITSHWDPPGDAPFPPPWPPAITTLITQSTPDTAPDATSPTTPDATKPGPPPPTTPYTNPGPPPPPPPYTPRAHTPPPPSQPPPSTDPWATLRSLAVTAHELASTLGPDHLDTLIARRNHALCLGAMGSHNEAVRYLSEIVADCERSLGHKHSVTLAVRHEHAVQLGAAGAHGEAARLLSKVAHQREGVLGKNHLDTLMSWHMHAYHSGQMGHHHMASGHMARVARQRTLVLGPEHPDTLAARHNHAYRLGQSGQERRAVEILGPVTEAYARVLGPDHPDTLAALHNLAVFLQRCGNVFAAQRIFMDIEANRARQSGPYGTGGPGAPPR